MRPSDVTDAPEGTTGATMDPNVDATNALSPSSDSIRGEPVPNSPRDADQCGGRDPKNKAKNKAPGDVSPGACGISVVFCLLMPYNNTTA